MQLKNVYNILLAIFEGGWEISGVKITGKMPSNFELVIKDDRIIVVFKNKINVLYTKIKMANLNLIGIEFNKEGIVAMVERFMDIPVSYEELEALLAKK